MIINQFLSLFISLLLNFNTYQIEGKVIKVYDGDTLTILTNQNETEKIRLEGIDCPELSQDFGKEARDYTSKLTLNRNVTIYVKSIGRYGRKIALVILPNGKVLNDLLLKNGYAWHYKAYNQEKKFEDLENEAKSKKIGLWELDNPIPPWDYRKKAKTILSIPKSNKSNILRNDSVLICNSYASKTFHNSNCSGLNRCKSEITIISIAKAKNLQRVECKFCY